ncbi:MAG TPA: IS110 family transposase [Bryobacteraceae bacterium]|nr:IS110 family transposase [Bryobacteraceae bacterium]
MQKVFYVGLDVHKASISVAAAEDGRDGPVRFIGPIPNTPTDVAKMAKRLAKDGQRLEFCYEAGCCGYGIYRHLTSLGHGCMVVAPSKIPVKAGDRIKNDRRDCQKLAVMHRSGDLTAVWVPDEVHEAMRDLVRARMDATMQSKRARQQLLAFLLRHGRNYPPGQKNWTKRHFVWLAGQNFEQPAHRIVFQDYVEAVLTAADRTKQLIERITALLPDWSMRPLVEALRGLRGIDLISAVTFVAAVGDLSRFETPRKLMAYLGLVPSEHSSGDQVRRGGITKTGNSDARRMLIEASWCYRYPARVAMKKAEIIIDLSKPVRDIAWKAQTRLCERFRRLSMKGKKPTVVATAIARELCGFIWAIGQQVSPTMP